MEGPRVSELLWSFHQTDLVVRPLLRDLASLRGRCRRGLGVPRALCPLSDLPTSPWVLGLGGANLLAAHQKHRICDPTSQPRAPLGGSACQGSVRAAWACRAGPHGWPGGLGMDLDPSAAWGAETEGATSVWRHGGWVWGERASALAEGGLWPQGLLERSWGAPKRLQGQNLALEAPQLPICFLAMYPPHLVALPLRGCGSLAGRGLPSIHGKRLRW